MKALTFPALIGLALCCLGLTVMSGWITHSVSLISFLSANTHMSFNTALLFLISGVTLVFSEFMPKIKNSCNFIGGIILVVLAGLTLSQMAGNFTLGIDQFFVTDWLHQTNLHPGRMAPNTALAFLTAGAAFLLFPFSHGKFFALLAQICIFGVLILGLSAALGYALNLHVLYGWYQGVQMSLQSAVGLALLGAGLWVYWNQHTGHQLFYSGKADKKILVLTALIVICVLLFVGTFGISLVAVDGGISYQEVRGKIFLALMAATMIAVVVLYLEIIPLVRSVMRSEKKLQQANQQLQESENRFRLAFDSAAVGMALISPKGRCLRVNAALCQLLGLTEQELLNTEIKKIVYPDDLRKDTPYFQELLNSKIKRYQSEQRLFHKNGDTMWARVSLSLAQDAEAQPKYFISQIQNITAEKRAEEQLRQMAYHDPLTGLANRNKLEQYIQQMLFTAHRQQMHFALIFCDLDNFKNINDTIGHDAGDLLLQVVAERLKLTVRNTDLVARLGGDEFVLLVTHVRKVDAVARIAQQILHNMLKPIVIKGHELYVTTSIGISFYPHDGSDLQTLMKNADLALYRAKESGRNNYQFCTPEMTAKAHEKMIRQNALSHALVKEEFVLCYQPKVDLENHKISGVEALLRWRNKEYSTVSTEEVIALAEESGLIIALSEWILKTACQQVKVWQKAGFGPLTVSINLSPRQFKQINFVQTVLEVLNDSDLPASSLEFEMTENLLMQDPTNTMAVLQDLKKAGVKLSIDDFGTGFSSLSHLKRFSVDKLKIDRTFVSGLPSDPTSISIVTAVIAMANKLGIKTLAEGVETKEQYAFLLKEKCTEMQGYLISRPLSEEAMLEFLKQSAQGIDFITPHDGEYESR